MRAQGGEPRRGKLAAQAPLTHTWLALQVVPQPPRSGLGSPGEGHARPWQFAPAGHDWVQTPSAQAWPPVHTVLSAPQSFELLRRLAQAVVCPALLNDGAGTLPPAHWAAQAPLLQIWPAGQALPHSPQLRALVCSVVHRPPQRVCVGGQLAEHLPPTQGWPEGQVSPQAPQLSGWVSRSAHPLPQSVRPTAQVPVEGKSTYKGSPAPAELLQAAAW